jgi:hypothetical protein
MIGKQNSFSLTLFLLNAYKCGYITTFWFEQIGKNATQIRHWNLTTTKGQVHDYFYKYARYLSFFFS